MAVNKEQHEYFCAACGGGIEEKEFKSGKAIRRKDKAYCRKCFKKAFPDECEAHPGVKATVRCSVCRRMCCENCVIEIAGKQVCSRCKDWALGKLADGEELEPDSSLFPDFDKARRKRKRETFQKVKEAGLKLGKSEVVRDKVLSRRWEDFVMTLLGVAFFSIFGGGVWLYERAWGAWTLVTVAALLLFLVLFVWSIVHMIVAAGSLRIVQVDNWGVSGTTFKGRTLQTAWEEVTRVQTRRPHFSQSSTVMRGIIKVSAGRKIITIRGDFPRFMFIADFIRDICNEKGIRYEERAV